MFASRSLARLIQLYINILNTRVCVCVFIYSFFFFFKYYCVSLRAFYLVCNIDASDVCAIKIAYLLTYLLTYHRPLTVWRSG